MRISRLIAACLLCFSLNGFGQKLKDSESIRFNLGGGLTFMPIVSSELISSHSTSSSIGGGPPLAVNPTYSLEKRIQFRSNLMASTCTIIPLKKTGNLKIDALLRLEVGVHLPWTEFEDVSFTVAGEADIYLKHNSNPDIGVYFGYKYSYWGLQYRQPLLGFKFGRFEYYGSIYRSINYRLLSTGELIPALTIREIGMRIYFSK